jgi:hypothetical protein
MWWRGIYGEHRRVSCGEETRWTPIIRDKGVAEALERDCRRESGEDGELYACAR